MTLGFVFLNSDLTIYGRYGARYACHTQTPYHTLKSFKETLGLALETHHQYSDNPDQMKKFLAGKKIEQSQWRTPNEIPDLKNKKRYVNPQDKCIWCHKVQNPETIATKIKGNSISDKFLFPYPSPDPLGFSIDPDAQLIVAKLEKDSPAEKAGFKNGDRIKTIDEQPIISLADIQWVLHNAPDEGMLKFTVERGGTIESLSLPLAKGWRRYPAFQAHEIANDIFGFGYIKEYTDNEKNNIGIEPSKMALETEPARFTKHALAKAAGFVPGDVIVKVDNCDTLTHVELLFYLLNDRKVGDEVVFTVLRGKGRKTLSMTLSWDRPFIR